MGRGDKKTKKGKIAKPAVAVKTPVAQVQQLGERERSAVCPDNSIQCRAA
jgi:hypothetical protein